MFRLYELGRASRCGMRGICLSNPVVGDVSSNCIELPIEYIRM